MTGRIRVLHCPTDVGGHPPGLARAEREIGLDSWCVTLEQHYSAYGSDEVLFRLGDGAAKRQARRLALLRRALRDFDVIHLNFGQSILSPPMPPLPGATGPRVLREAYTLYTRLLGMRDLHLLRRAGKGIVVTYQGDDARQGDRARATQEISIAHEVGPDYYTPRSDRAKRRMIAQVARTAHRIHYLNPDLAHVLPARATFLSYASVDPRRWTPPPRAPGVGDTVTVVHAPTHREVKGTRHVIDAVDALRAEGVPVELVLVEGMSREDARRTYERADILVDQLLAGWYGGLATELMALGRPVITYMREGDLGCLPGDMRRQIPLISATPTTIRDVLREWVVSRRGELAVVGAAARAFVERWHEPRAIARTLADEYRAVLAEIRGSRGT